MKKSKLLVVLLLAAILSMAVLACASATEVECPHTATKRIVGKDATCTQDGYYSILCQCGKLVATNVEGIPAKGHSWMTDLHVTKEATCAAEGAGYYNCKNCAELNKVSIPKDASKHTDIQREVGKAATCTEDGHYSERCHGCAALVATNVETIPAKGHSWMTDLHVTKEATCAAEGAGYYNCQNCAEVKNEALPKDASKHTDIQREVGKAATCTEDGHYSERCHGCAALVNTNVEAIPAKGHDWNTSEPHTAKEPTCAAEGVGYYNCRNCAEVQQFAIAKVNHDFEMPPTTIDPGSCKREGVIRYYCLNCDYTRDMTLPPDGPHTFNTQEMIVDKAPTCTDKGIGHYACSECGEAGNSKDIPALGHDWNTSEPHTLKEPTCAAEGVGYYNCRNCAEVQQFAIAKVNHDFEMPPTTIDPGSCKREGVIRYYCLNCDYTRDMTLPPDGPHTFNTQEMIVDKAPTCTDKGIGHYACSECGEAGNSKDIPALGHDYVAYLILPTCFGYGEEGEKCSRCNEIKPDSVTKLEMISHDWSDPVVEVQPTCTHSGEGYQMCTNDFKTGPCTATKRIHYDPLGHKDEDGLLIKGKEPTCHTEGSNHYDCDRCGEILERITVPCLNPEARTFVRYSATCTQMGYCYSICGICGEKIPELQPVGEHEFRNWPSVSATDETYGMHNPNGDASYCIYCGTLGSPSDSYIPRSTRLIDGEEVVSNATILWSRNEDGTVATISNSSPLIEDALNEATEATSRYEVHGLIPYSLSDSTCTRYVLEEVVNEHGKSEYFLLADVNGTYELFAYTTTEQVNGGWFIGTDGTILGSFDTVGNILFQDKAGVSNYAGTIMGFNHYNSVPDNCVASNADFDMQAFLEFYYHGDEEKIAKVDPNNCLIGKMISYQYPDSDGVTIPLLVGGWVNEEGGVNGGCGCEKCGYPLSQVFGDYMGNNPRICTNMFCENALGYPAN